MLSYNDTVIGTLQADNSGRHKTKGAASQASDIAFITTLTAPASWDIEDQVPSAWLEHIPFMHCLMTEIGPRRYVELGAHFGASFFAACHAAKKLQMDTECIAIDTWQGDTHIGQYSESVFNQFVSILQNNYSSVGRYIRKDFASAAAQFEPGSIDLLHIDGTHTYEAVKDDFHTWLPKLSSTGIIIFHDTHVRQGDFGVYRLWDELSKTYPSIHFEHGHGLGLIYVGSDMDSAELAFVRRLMREDIGVFMRQHFSNLGRLLTKHTALTEKAPPSSAEMELASLRASTGYRMLTRYYRLRDAICPSNSWRHKIYSLFIHNTKRALQKLKALVAR